MRGLQDNHDGFGPATTPWIRSLVVQARFGRADLALEQLDAALPALENAPDAEPLMLSLYLRAIALRVLGARSDECLAACDLLDQAATQRRTHGWTATAWAMRARIRVDTGAVGAAITDLAQADQLLEPEHLDADSGFALMDTLAETYHRLRLHDRAEETRRRLESNLARRPASQLAMHWSSWSYEACSRAVEPLAGGVAEPEQDLLDQAVELAIRVQGLPADELPPQLLRGVAGVRALAAAFRGRAAEALRLLGSDAFAVPTGLSPVPTRLVTLAAMRAHAQVGSIPTARNIDDAAAGIPDQQTHLVLEVVRARERLWLESYAGGDVIPVLDRMTQLLIRLGWSGMDLVADTARQALEHQALRTESRTDALTGVGNRRSMDEELRQLLRFSPLPTALVLVDIDDFKEINDRYSHVVGDQVLRRVAGCLVKQLRSSDRLLRYGGDEFVALLPNTGDEEANRVAARMSTAVLERPWNELADGLQVTITTGCAAAWTLTGRRPDADAERLFLRADEQLLQAKRRRRERGTGPLPIQPQVQPADRQVDLLPVDLHNRDVVQGEVVRRTLAPAGYLDPSPTSSIPVPGPDSLPAVIDLAQHERSQPYVWPAGHEPGATVEPGPDPDDWPDGDPLTDPWVDHG